MSEGGEVFYRYSDFSYSNGVDEYGDPLPGRGRTAIRCHEFNVIKRTPCGAWIDDPYNALGKRFVLLHANKRYALPSKLEALESFIARKKRQISICLARVEIANEAIAVANRTAADILGPDA